ncbi:MAG TPA: hypothetical protein VK172_02780 [Lentimicrobium sp.]|nr:hypothetical protein [Lentimicrobium sp.]
MDNVNKYWGIRWIARVIATIIIAIVLFIVIQEYLEELNHGESPFKALSSLATSAYPMLFEWILTAFAIFGLIIAYWKEGFGGIISLVSFLVLFYRLSSDEFNGFIVAAILIISIPCVLYIVYWWKMQTRSKNK